MTSSTPTILCDLDGTLYSSGVNVDGAIEAIRELRRMGCVLRFFTNTDSKSEAGLLADLRARGFDVGDQELFTSVSAARELLRGEGAVNVLPIVSRALRETFAPFAGQEGAPVTHVIVADTRDTLSYPLLDAGFRAVRAGAKLIALHRGRYVKGADGDHVDTGAIVAALEYASGKTAIVVGKPSEEFLRLAAGSAGVEPGEVWIVGDDATTDIAMGNRAGATTVQVRTGKYADQRVERDAIRAVHEIDSIASLPRVVADAIHGSAQP